jgi:hypothetical protein
MLVENAVEVVIVRSRVPLLNLQQKSEKNLNLRLVILFIISTHIGSVGDPNIFLPP